MVARVAPLKIVNFDVNDDKKRKKNEGEETEGRRNLDLRRVVKSVSDTLKKSICIHGDAQMAALLSNLPIYSENMELIYNL